MASGACANRRGGDFQVVQSALSPEDKLNDAGGPERPIAASGIRSDKHGSASTELLS